MSDKRTPILVGVGQIVQRTDDIHETKEPIELMDAALRLAAQDCGIEAIVNELGSIRVIKGVWPYRDPGAFLASAFELNGIETGITIMGGNGVQTTVSLSCSDIQSGKFDAIAIVGGECGRTQAKAQQAGIRDLGWQDIPGRPSWEIPTEALARHELENARGLGGASQMYAIIENALRFENQRTINEHNVHVSELWSRFNDVAQNNPNAWIQRDVSAAEIRETGPQNRPIAFPYPKLMNANNRVDMGAALLLCSQKTARRLGIPQEKWVYPWCATDGLDTKNVSSRAHLTEAPGLRRTAERVLELAELDSGQLDYVDLYSCFPSAVQVAAKEIGLPIDSQLTVTGGLTFGGGPLNDYVTHAIARMVEVLRENPDTKGLITANGGILSKHAHCVYSTAPPPKPFCHENVQATVDTSQDRQVEPNPKGPVVVDGYTVVFDRDHAVRLAASALTQDGKRTWGYSNDPDLMQSAQSEEFCGSSIRLNDAGQIQIG